jgi:hypothetical protein
LADCCLATLHLVLTNITAFFFSGASLALWQIFQASRLRDVQVVRFQLIGPVLKSPSSVIDALSDLNQV